MKKLILLLITTLTIISCNEAVEADRIPWTSTSEEAKILFEQFLTNVERSNWNPETQEALFDSIAKLDPNFFVPKLFNNFKDAEERRALVRLAYANRDKVSDLESRIIEANYERRINGTIIRQDQIMDSMIIDFPQYDQLRIWSGDIKNGLDVKAGEKRWKEALEINPNSFEAYVNLAFLHFPTGNNFNMLATDERNLDKAETLLNNAKKILPQSSRPSRFLGNVYRAQSKFDEALASYKESLKIINKYESGDKSDPYANSLLMVGHVYTFQEKYDQARNYYDDAIKISNEYWKVSISELKSHTYMYQKDFAGAVYLLSQIQDDIKSFDIDTVQKINYTIWMESAKFRAFGHSQKQEETIGSMGKIKELRASREKILLSNAFDDNEKERFIKGAKLAYETIITSFGKGELNQLKHLLEKNIYKNFSEALKERKEKKIKSETTFVGIKSTKIKNFSEEDNTQTVTVDFISEIITFSKNNEDKIISGDPEKIKVVSDTWKFSKDLKINNPNWLLIQT